MGEPPQRVRLRPLRDDDAAAWIALHGDADAMARIAAPLAAAEAQRRFRAALAAETAAPPRQRSWVIEADGAFAGIAGLLFDGSGTAELGAILVPAAQRRGIATRALALLIAHAFATWPAIRLHTRHDADHAGAAGLMRTLGFARTAAADSPKGWRWACDAPVAPPRSGDSLEAIG